MTNSWERARKKNMQELRGEVEEEGNIKVVPMWQLRDAAGWDKLGRHVVSDIAALLHEHGMGTLPAGESLPLAQSSSVRVYVQRSRVGELVEAVTNPSGRGDAVLREA